MLFGADPFTNFHVAISLIGIASGIIVLIEMLRSKPASFLTGIFLLTTILTSVTGFGFPFGQLLPSHIVGIISLVVLAVAVYARYGAHMSSHWRWIYVVTATLALYLNVFVLVVQLFLKVETLNNLAPTQAEPPFAIAQGITLVTFIILGFLAVRRFRPA